jgi:hypothetical protein
LTSLKLSNFLFAFWAKEIEVINSNKNIFFIVYCVKPQRFEKNL